MKPLPFFASLLNIKQHFKYLDEVLREQAPHNASRVEAMWRQIQYQIEVIYTSGEGWIEKDVRLILDAIQFAANKHHTQVRKDPSQTSYLIHPLSVTHHLMTVGKVRDPAIIIACLLHDTLEDTDTSYDEIAHLFGLQAADFVKEVTDDKSLPKEERKRLQILHASSKSAGASQIKLADKWNNLNDLLEFFPQGWSEQRVQAYFEWSKEVVESLPWVNACLLNAVKEVLHKRIR